MNLGWTTATYFLSIAANIGLFFGVLSSVYWVNDHVDDFMFLSKSGVKSAIYCLYAVYIMTMSFVNGLFPASHISHPWAFLNLITILVFSATLWNVTRFTMIIEIGIFWLYYFSGASRYVIWGMLALFTESVGIYLANKYARKYLNNRLMLYGLFALIAGSQTIAVTSMAVYDLDIWFWVRQIGALIIEGVSVIEYTLMLIRRQATEKVIRWEATHDELTGLYNFGKFNDDLQVSFEAERVKRTVSRSSSLISITLNA